jgi:putative ATPase
MLILSSEDRKRKSYCFIMANNTFQAVATMATQREFILSQCAVYLATSPKSNASYLAIGTAQQPWNKPEIYQCLFIYAMRQPN